MYIWVGGHEMRKETVRQGKDPKWDMESENIWDTKVEMGLLGGVGEGEEHRRRICKNKAYMKMLLLCLLIFKY